MDASPTSSSAASSCGPPPRQEGNAGARGGGGRRKRPPPRACFLAHRWYQMSTKKWICAACRVTCQSDKTLQARTREACPGHCELHSRLVADPRGHDVYFLGYADPQVPLSILLCRRCGTFSECDGRGFQTRCPPKGPSTKGKLQIQRAFEIRHPQGRLETLSSCCRLGP